MSNSDDLNDYMSADYRLFVAQERARESARTVTLIVVIAFLLVLLAGMILVVSLGATPR
jgi:hypothetical protein